MNRIGLLSMGISVGALGLAVGCASDSEVMVKGEESAVVADELAALGISTDPATCPKACTPRVCETVKPTNALVTDWQDTGRNGLFVDGDAYSHDKSNWWEGFFGGPYVYPAVDPCSADEAPEYPLTQTTDGSWQVTGTVGTWSGFGLWFGPCMVDLSAYRGVSLEIWGEVGESHQLIFDVLTSQNSKPSECNPNVGTCDPTTTACKSATKIIDVPVTSGNTVTLLWSDFTSGVPSAGVDPTQINGFHFAFKRVEWGGVTTAPFPVNVNVGTLRLIP